MSKPVALLTGLTGMVVWHLVDYLLEETEWDLVGLIRWWSPLENIDRLGEGPVAKVRMLKLQRHRTIGTR